MAASTTQLSTKFYEKSGYQVANVEKHFRFPDRKKRGKWIVFKRDLFGAWDLVCLKGDVLGLTGVQSTTVPNMNARIKKVLASEAIKNWLLAGNKGIVMGWAKENNRWIAKTREIKSEELK